MSIRIQHIVSSLVFSLGLCALLTPKPAHAQGFATPPPGRSIIAGDSYDGGYDSVFVSDRDGSVVRLFVGPGGMLSSKGAAPGMLAALEFGRGPAGLRLSGSWFDVGSETGIQQYTGEITLDFGGRSRLRPNVGAGGGLGVASSSVRSDGTIDPEKSSVLGVGLLRAGLAYKIPLREADARLAFDITGTLPAIRAKDAPDLSPWLFASVMVGIGF